MRNPYAWSSNHGGYGSADSHAGAPVNPPGTAIRARRAADDTAQDTGPSGNNSVLLLSDEAAIISVLEGHGDRQGDRTELSGDDIDALYPDPLCNRIREQIRRTLRTRQVQSDSFEDVAAGVHYDLVFVAQGRDRVMVVIRDVSEEKLAISRMQQLAYADEATGLPNREFLLERLDRIVESLRLKEGRAAVICFVIDPDSAHGSAVGLQRQEFILKELADRLVHGLRGANSPDTMNEERYSIAARVDFRKFGIVLPIIDNGSDAAAVAERVAADLQRPVKVGDKEIRIMVRGGIALFPQDGTDAKTLFENAHAAMEDARNTGETHKFHSGTVKMRALQRQDLELEMRSALDREEFVLNYLPVVSAGTRRVASIEALLRWPQAIFGSNSIDKVVSLAERTGLIVPIGEWVMRRGCRQLKQWQEAGHPDLRLAINLSAQEFSRPDLAIRMARTLEAESLDPQFLDLEITEHILFRDGMSDFKTCRELKDIGVAIIVDDYGTGACSLAHLSHSPVDAVKIDNSFVTYSDTNPDDRAACAAAIAMAHELGMYVIAEGVETEQQASVLHDQGCDFLQGFLFFRPAPADELGAWLDGKPSRGADQSDG